MKMITKDHSDFAYRPDIDGLRAVAVLAVVGFHALPHVFPGGFLGVDVFFVISGYLITGLIYQQLEQGRFSLLDFYARRIKRLLPSLAVVSLVVVLSSSYLLIPNDFMFFTTSLASAWGFVANLFFSLLSWGYFGQRSEGFPFLHTWSLSVEEQFYCIFPLLLIFLVRYAKAYLTTIFLIGSIVFTFLSEYGTGRVGSYFLLQFRAHELLIGVVCYFLMLQREFRSPLIAHVSAIVGLGGMMASIFLMRRDLPLPGFLALVPCMGAALVIASGVKATWVRAILSQRLLVGLGLISYPLYLWHWPIFAFLNYRKVTMTWPILSIAFMLSLALAYLTWRFVEQPIRHSQERRLMPLFLKFYAVPASIFLALGIVSYQTEGIPQRFSHDLREIMSSYSYERDLTRSCAIRGDDKMNIDYGYLTQHCAFGDLTQKSIDVLLFGDSHAQHFKPFVDVLMQDAHLKAVYHVEGSCDSLDLHLGEPQQASRCQQRNQAMLAIAHRFKYVVIASSWSYKGQEALFKDRLTLAVESILKAHAIPIVFKDNPSTEEDLSRCVLFQRRNWGAPDQSCALSLEAVLERQASVDRMIDQVQANYPSTIVIDPKEVMCDTRSCFTYHGNIAYYKDANHLNTRASAFIAEQLLQRSANPFQRGKYLWTALQSHRGAP